MSIKLHTALILCSVALTSYSGVVSAKLVHSSSTNYSLQETSNALSGAQYCRSQDVEKIWLTCIPVKNFGKTELYIDFSDDNGKSGNVTQLPSGDVAVDANMDSSHDDKIKVVDFKNRDKVIYEGTARNKVGLTCNEKGCKPWTGK